jgi:HEPN domain-containing protein
LKTANYQKSQEFFDLATFSLEQAIQLHLKAKLLSWGVEYPRTHSLRKLLQMLSEIAPEGKKQEISAILKNRLLELGMLEDAYITARYVMRDFTKAEVERLTKAVTEMINIVQ